jgi:hypothetical protein
MLPVFLFSLFESGLFPDNILLRTKFNPAHLARENFEFLSFGQQKFGLVEFRSLDLSLQSRSFSLGLNGFGGEYYRETRVALGFGFGLNRNLAAGVEIDLLNNWVKDYVNRFGYGLKLGGLYQAGQFIFGALVNNLNQPRFSAIDRLPVSYGIDFRYAASVRFTPYFSILGSDRTPPFFRFGIALAPAPPVQITAGVNTDPVQLEYGFRFRIRSLNILYAGSTHSQLGLTHGLGLQFAAP